MAPETITVNDGVASGTRNIAIPNHRLTPFKVHWRDIYLPIVTHMKLDIRFNTPKHRVELRTNPTTTDPKALQKAAEFIRAIVLGFEIGDAVALLRLDDLFIDSFDIDEVKFTLGGEGMSRAIGRIAGTGGKVRNTLENATTTRIVIHDKHIHILGTDERIKIARRAVQDIVLGAPPAKVFNKLQTVAAFMK